MGAILRGSIPQPNLVDCELVDIGHNMETGLVSFTVRLGGVTIRTLSLNRAQSKAYMQTTHVSGELRKCEAKAAKAALEVVFGITFTVNAGEGLDDVFA